MTLFFLLYLLQLATPPPARAADSAEKSATSSLTTLFEPAKAPAQSTDWNGGGAASDAVLWGIEPVEDGSENDVLFACSADGKVWAAPLGSANCPKIGETRDGGTTEIRYSFGLRRPAIVSKRWSFAQTSYFRQNATREIAGLVGTTGCVSVSWAVPDVQIPRDPTTVEIRPANGAPVRIAAPKNDFESFQIALRPTKGDLRGVSAAVVGDLRGPNGATIPATNVDLRYAYYRFVSHPTDELGAVDRYPDALVPLEDGSDGEGAPLDVESGRNLSIWATVKVPTDAAAGVYRGALRSTANGGDASGSASSSASESKPAFDVLVPFEPTV